MRNLLVFLLAGLIGGALYFAWSRRAREKESAKVEEARAPTPTREEPAREPAERPVGQPARERARPQPSDELTPPAPVPAAIAGTVVVLDEHGVEHPSEHGILALGLGTAGARTHREVEVRDGRWSLDLADLTERKASLAVLGCVLDRRVAVVAAGQAAELALPSDGQVALRVEWRAGPLLHVRSRDGGRELEEVHLYELPTVRRGSPADARHPGPAAESGARAVGPSPVRFEAASLDALGTRVLFAKGPGHAWGRIEVDPSAAEHTLMLEPAGTLELAVVGEPQLSTLEILLLETAPPHAEVLDLQRGVAKTFLIADLPAGRYIARARFYGMPAGAIEVDIPAGERVKAVLDVVSPPTAPVPFEGVLVVPAEWELDDFMLEFLLQGRFDDGSLTQGSFEIRRSEMTLEAGSHDRYRWNAPNARAARYRIQLFPIPFATELDTGPMGTRDALIEVPSPCLLSLRCVDEAGAGVFNDQVSFCALTPRAFAGRALGSPRPDFLAPQGRVLIFTTPGSHEPMARVVDAGAGKNEVLLPARKKP